MSKIVDVYDYRDESDKLLFQVVRYDPKMFKQRTPNGKGDWDWKLNGVRRVLFKLPEMVKAIGSGHPIFVCEGEKDVLAMMDRKLSATCNSGGAEKWLPEYNESLRGAVVGIVADKDIAGHMHAQLVAKNLHGIAASIRVIELPDVDGTPVKDAADYFAAGGDAKNLGVIYDETPEWKPESSELPIIDNSETNGIPTRLNSTSCIPASCISTSLHHTSVLQKITARKVAEKQFKEHAPELVEFYYKVVEPRFQSVAQGRNTFIKDAIPFLYRAVGVSQLIKLVGFFYDTNAGLFKDPRDQHMKQAEAHLKVVATTYVQELKPEELSIYNALDGNLQQETFRICRDLARLPDPDFPPPKFFISFGQLGIRLGIHPMQAQRIMRRFATDGLLLPLVKGTRRSAGKTAKAGTYEWLL